MKKATLIFLICLHAVVYAQNSISAQNIIECVDDEAYPATFLLALKDYGWTLSDHEAKTTPVKTFTYTLDYIMQSDTSVSAFVFFSPDVDERWVMLLYKPTAFWEFNLLRVKVTMLADRIEQKPNEYGEMKDYLYIGKTMFSFYSGINNIVSINYVP